MLHLDLSTVDGPSWKPLPVRSPRRSRCSGTRRRSCGSSSRGRGRSRRSCSRSASRAGSGAWWPAPPRRARLRLRRGSSGRPRSGNSEGLMVACVLGAIDRHLVGQAPRRARVGRRGGAAAPRGLAVPRPLRRLAALQAAAGRRLRLAVAFGCLPVLWFLPEYWGSGDFHRAADRAQEPLSNSAAFADHPWVKVLENSTKLMTAPLWVGLGLALVLLLSKRVPPHAAKAAAGVALLGLLWLGLVAYMTEHGYSGNQRYLVVPAVLMVVVSATAIGWLMRAVPLAILAAVVFAAPSFAHLGDLERTLRYQGRLGAPARRRCRRRGRQGPPAARAASPTRRRSSCLPSRGSWASTRRPSGSTRNRPRLSSASRSTAAHAGRRRCEACRATARSAKPRTGGSWGSAGEAEDRRRRRPADHLWPGCAAPRCTRPSGSTRACPSASPRTRSSTSPASSGRTARRRCTTCCCTSGWRSSATARRRRTC